MSSFIFVTSFGLSKEGHEKQIDTIVQTKYIDNIMSVKNDSKFYNPYKKRCRIEFKDESGIFVCGSLEDYAKALDAIPGPKEE